jgi:hypothetical protein
MVLYASTFKTLIQPWLHERPIESMMVSSSEVWLSSEEVAPFPYNKTWEEARWDPLVVLHTSGSTGIPKPIIVRQGMLCISDAFHNLPEMHGTTCFIDELTKRMKRMLMPSKIGPYTLTLRPLG